MRKTVNVLAVAIVLLCLCFATKFSSAQTISTMAGGGTVYLDNSGLMATNARLIAPMAVAVNHTTGDVYFADYGNSGGGAVVYKVTSEFWISIVAGTGARGYTGDGGPATSATFGLRIGGISIAPSGNIYISDLYNNVVRKVTVSTGVISTYAGTGIGGFRGDGGQATSALLSSPIGIVVTASDLYIADGGNNRIRHVNSTGVITTVAGNGTQAFAGDGGLATSAELTFPWALALHPTTGDIYIGDIGLNNANCRIRKVTVSTGVISTYSGNAGCGEVGDGGPVGSAELGQVMGLAFDSTGNNLYIADSTGMRVREVVGTTIFAVAGNGNSGFAGDGGSPTAAVFNSPQGIAVNGSTYYIADTNNGRIRKVQ